MAQEEGAANMWTCNPPGMCWIFLIKCNENLFVFPLQKILLSEEQRVDYVQVDEQKTQALQSTKQEWTDERQSKVWQGRAAGGRPGSLWVFLLEAHWCSTQVKTQRVLRPFGREDICTYLPRKSRSGLLPEGLSEGPAPAPTPTDQSISGHSHNVPLLSLRPVLCCLHSHEKQRERISQPWTGM